MNVKTCMDVDFAEQGPVGGQRKPLRAKHNFTVSELSE